jgi:hypothetical protein
MIVATFVNALESQSGSHSGKCRHGVLRPVSDSTYQQHAERVLEALAV